MSSRAGGSEKPPRYHSYLLRLWQVNGGEEDWRASLESARGTEYKSFATLDALFAYVRAQTRANPNGYSRVGDQNQERR
jgi:hypothetical protein